MPRQKLGLPGEPKGFGQNEGMKWKKSVQPASRKPEKAAWAKKGIPVDWKPERAVQEKIRDWCVTLCLVGSSCNQTSVSTIQLGWRQSIWSTFDQAAKWWDARGHKGNSRIGTQWDCSHSCFVFHNLCKFYLLGGVLLLGRQPLVQKRLFTGQTSKSIQFIFKEISNCSSLSFLFCKERPMFIFDICIWH